MILGHLISTKHNRSPLQIDLAPTLSVLMGLPIPNNNLGQVLQGALEAGGLGVEAILDVLYINSLQIVQLMEANVLSYKSGMPLEYLFCYNSFQYWLEIDSV